MRLTIFSNNLFNSDPEFNSFGKSRIFIVADSMYYSNDYTDVDDNKSLLGYRVHLPLRIDDTRQCYGLDRATNFVRAIDERLEFGGI